MASTQPIGNKNPLPESGALDAAIAAVQDFVYVFGLDGRFTYANPALHRLLQLGPGELVGLNFFDLGYPDALAETLQDQIKTVIETKELVRAETPFESAFGLGYYEYIFVPILDVDDLVTGVAGTTRDITKRRAVEEALLSSQRELSAEREKLRNLFEQAPAFICVLEGPDFTYTFANEGYYKLVGRDDILGKTVASVLPEVVEQGYIRLLKQVYSTGEPYIGREDRVILEVDGSHDEHFVDFIYQAVRNASGEVTNILVHGTDITAQVVARREVERLNEELERRVEERTDELRRANRELEGFTYSVAHDLRSPLRAIISSSRTLQDDYGSRLDERANQELVRQVAGATKLAQLIDDLLKLSRLSRHKLRKQPIDLTDVALTVAREIALLYPDHSCVFEVEPGMKVVADSTCVFQLLLNLMENACKFSSPGSRVSVASIDQPANTIFFVRDHGIGFEMQYVEKVFQPFERLVSDKQFPGTGIGLANVKRVVELHGGKVWAESAPSHGSTFFFTLSPDSP